MNYIKSSARKVTSGFFTAVLVVGSVVATGSVAQAAAITIDATNISLPYTSNHSSANSPAYYYEVQAPSNGTLTIKSCNSGVNTTITLERVTAGGRATSAITDTSALTLIAADSTAVCTSNDETKTYTVTANTWYYAKVTGSGNGVISTEITFSGTSTPTYVELDRVTICHRTHATTNPYRIITVSTSSIVDGSGNLRGHGKHATDARRYDPNLYGVYDSTRTYRANAKLWGDIIPPFKDRATGGIFPGLNWSWNNPTASAGAGGQVFDKTAFGTVTQGSSNAVHQAAVNACKGASGNLTAKQLFDLERKNGEKRQDILDEIAETDAFESDPANKEKTVLDTQLPAKEGPKKQPANQIAQSLAGVVWLDVNRNGFQEDNEPNMSNIKVTVQQGTAPVAMGGTFSGFGTGAKVLQDTFGTNALTSALDSLANSFSGVINSVRSIFGMATTYTVYTDINGSYLFKSLNSGDWYVSGVVPSGLEVTYDSLGSADAVVDTTVPAGGFAFTWIGLVGSESTGINAPVKNPDGSTVTKDVVITYAGVDGAFCTEDDVNYVLTPVNGKVAMTGISAGKYYVRQIGTTATIADFTITSGAIYTSEIKTTTGVRCPVLKDSELAATGGQVNGKAAGALGLLLVGLLATFVGVRRSRATS